MYSAYLFIASIFFLESIPFIGRIVPAGFLIVIGGFLAGRNYLDAPALIAAASLGGILGDLLSYYLGSEKNSILNKNRRFLKISHLEKAQAFALRHGDQAVILSKFRGFLRPLMPFLNGISRKPFLRFFLIDSLGIIIWVTSAVLFGYFFLGILNLVEMISTRIEFFLLLLLLLFLIIWGLIKRIPTLFSIVQSIGDSIKIAFWANKDFVRFVTRYPRLAGFIKDRLNIRTFAGLPFTAISLSLLYLWSLFGGLTDSMLNSGIIHALDIRTANLLYVFRDGSIVDFFLKITLLGEAVIIISLTAVCSILFWLWRRNKFIVPFWITLAGSSLLTVVAKAIIQRERPGGLLPIVTEHSFSFPSGHAAISFAFFGYLAYFLVKNQTKWRYKINNIFFCVIAVLLVGLSRLYLGVHFLSDVLGGYLIGLIWVIIGITITEWSLYAPSKRAPQISDSRPKKHVKRLTSILGLTALAVYAIPVIYYQPALNEIREEKIYVTVQGNPLDIFQAYNLSKYSEGLEGGLQEPMNFLIFARDDETLENAFVKAGWHSADKITVGSLIKTAVASLKNESYITAPMTPSFWTGEVNYFNFQKPTEENTVRIRHHARFWRTTIRHQNGLNLYIGTASFDSGMKWTLTHTISPDIDTERELIFSDLQSAGVIAEHYKDTITPPTLGKNFSGDQFFTDGKIYILTIR